MPSQEATYKKINNLLIPPDPNVLNAGNKVRPDVAVEVKNPPNAGAVEFNSQHPSHCEPLLESKPRGLSCGWRTAYTLQGISLVGLLFNFVHKPTLEAKIYQGVGAGISLTTATLVVGPLLGRAVRD